MGPQAPTSAHIYPAPQHVVLTSILEGGPAGCFEALRDNLSTMLHPDFGEGHLPEGG